MEEKEIDRCIETLRDAGRQVATIALVVSAVLLGVHVCGSEEHVSDAHVPSTIDK